MVGFTQSELETAKRVDLTAVASSLGYTVKKIGNYHTLAEMDSIRIYNRTNWYRWSGKSESGIKGGSQIDFLIEFANMDIKTAVFWLLDFAWCKSNCSLTVSSAHEDKEKRSFVLPEKASDNNYLYSYLINERAISRAVVDYFVSSGLIYESRKYHNIVFLGNDKEGRTRFASLRGVFDNRGKPFKCDVAGNDKRYGFNTVNDNSTELVVFEAAIDMMSYIDMFRDFKSNMLALGMVSDTPIETFLKEYPQIKNIRFCLDNDEPGRKASAGLTVKYIERGYAALDSPPPEEYKDYNEYLIGKKREKDRNTANIR